MNGETLDILVRILGVDGARAALGGLKLSVNELSAATAELDKIAKGRALVAESDAASDKRHSQAMRDWVLAQHDATTATGSNKASRWVGSKRWLNRRSIRPLPMPNLCRIFNRKTKTATDEHSRPSQS